MSDSLREEIAGPAATTAEPGIPGGVTPHQLAVIAAIRVMAKGAAFVHVRPGGIALGALVHGEAAAYDVDGRQIRLLQPERQALATWIMDAFPGAWDRDLCLHLDSASLTPLDPHASKVGA